MEGSTVLYPFFPVLIIARREFSAIVKGSTLVASVSSDKNQLRLISLFHSTQTLERRKTILANGKSVHVFIFFHFTHIIRNYFGFGPIFLERPTTLGKGHETTTTRNGIHQYDEQCKAMILLERTVDRRPHSVPTLGCSSLYGPLGLIPGRKGKSKLAQERQKRKWPWCTWYVHYDSISQTREAAKAYPNQRGGKTYILSLQYKLIYPPGTGAQWHTLGPSP